MVAMLELLMAGEMAGRWDTSMVYYSVVNSAHLMVAGKVDLEVIWMVA